MYFGHVARYILFVKQFKSNAAMVFHHTRKSKLSYFGKRTNGRDNLVDSATSVALNLVIYPAARNASIFQTIGIVRNTRKISNNRPASVASTQRSSVAHGNPPLPGLVSSFIDAFL